MDEIRIYQLPLEESPSDDDVVMIERENQPSRSVKLSKLKGAGPQGEPGEPLALEDVSDDQEIAVAGGAPFARRLGLGTLKSWVKSFALPLTGGVMNGQLLNYGSIGTNTITPCAAGAISFETGYYGIKVNTAKGTVFEVGWDANDYTDTKKQARFSSIGSATNDLSKYAMLIRPSGAMGAFYGALGVADVDGKVSFSVDANGVTTIDPWRGKPLDYGNGYTGDVLRLRSNYNFHRFYISPDTPVDEMRYSGRLHFDQTIYLHGGMQALGQYFDWNGTSIVQLDNVTFTSGASRCDLTFDFNAPRSSDMRGFVARAKNVAQDARGAWLYQIVNKDNGERTFGVQADGRVQTSADFVSDDAEKGVILKSPNGHYWRQTVSDTGVITTTDLGTTLPA